MKSKAHDYLKFWRVIRYYYKVRHNLTQSDFDMLFFLYSETYFSRDDFERFDQLLSWDDKRFTRLLKDGWIVVFRKRMGKRKTIYEMSRKGAQVISDVYRKLNGEEIPISNSQNPMFLKNVSYSDKVYRDMIIHMNESIRQLRHQTPEE